MRIHSYPTVFALGHKAIEQLLSGPVIVEEKVDGSQFSMSREKGELSCRSKGQHLIVDNPEKLFAKAVATAASLDLHDGWVYRCEYLSKPCHNTLAYSRAPERNLVIYDVEIGEQSYLAPAEKYLESARLGIECVPLIFEGILGGGMGAIQAWLERESMLGGCKIEGVVVKNYALFTPEKKVAVAKFVAPDFAEKNKVAWKASNPTTADVIDRLIEALRTPARWQKAVQHLRDAGELTESPKDIGALVKEAQADITKEERDWIAEELMNFALAKILRGSVRGLPEWYKEQLAAKAFTA